MNGIECIVAIMLQRMLFTYFHLFCVRQAQLLSKITLESWWFFKYWPSLKISYFSKDSIYSKIDCLSNANNKIIFLYRIFVIIHLKCAQLMKDTFPGF